MWRRIASSSLKTLAASDFAAASPRRLVVCKPVPSAISTSYSSDFLRPFSSESETPVKKNVEDVMPVTTKNERERLKNGDHGAKGEEEDMTDDPSLKGLAIAFLMTMALWATATKLLGPVAPILLSAVMITEFVVVPLLQFVATPLVVLLIVDIFKDDPQKQSKN